MPPKNARKAAARRRAKKEEQGSDIEDELPPEKPPRPFREVNELPMSLDPPEYNILNQPLSIKDSAVLYSSLMKSRKAFTASNVFDLYWAKGKTKFDNDVNARDRMNKLCDCGMEIGPHTYEIRFFILKDDEIEKKREEIKSKKKEKRMANKQLREEKKKVRELQAPNADGTGAPANGTSTTGDTATTANTTADKNEDDDDDSDDSDTDNEAQASATNPTQTDRPEEATVSPAPETAPEMAPETTPAPAPAEAPAQAPEPPAIETPAVTAPTPAPQQVAAQPEAPKEQPKLADQPKPKSLPLIHNSAQSQNTTPASTTPGASTTVQAPSGPITAPAPAPAPQPSQSANDMMQSPESQMMIANLNAIARADPSLNALMKIVASGSASSAQIREFQGYIQRAKSMGPPPFFKTQFPNYQPDVRPMRPPKPPKAPKPPREKQLTTFQEMYVDGADLVFEFSENPNVRYSLPKNCIVEKTENGDFIVSYLAIYNEEKINKWKARQEAKKEKAEKAKEAEEKKKLQMEANQKKKLEDEEKKKLEQEKQKAEEVKVEKRSSRRRAAKKKDDDDDDVEITDGQVKEEQAALEKAKLEDEEKKKQAALKKLEKKDDDPEPIPYFMPISFKITGMDAKYDPIILNSFKKHDEVFKYMEKVLKEGDRAPKYLLWYQVDAYDDEQLSENLREQLFLIENPPKKYKRRNVEENPLMAKPKRQRKEKKNEAAVPVVKSESAEATPA